MEKTSYDNFVRFLRDGAYPSCDFRRRFLFRQRAKRYTLYGLCLRLGSRILLHEEEVFDILQSFHLKKHVRGPGFYEAVRREYAVSPVQPLCQDDTAEERMYKKIGIPFVRDIGLHDAPDIDPSKFSPITIDMAGPRSCFCIVMSYVLSGTCEKTAAIEEWVEKVRRGPFSPHSTSGAEAPESLTDVTYLTQKDVKVIVSTLTNFFHLRATDGPAGKSAPVARKVLITVVSILRGLCEMGGDIPY